MGRTVGVVGLGAWQLGADWGEVSEADAHATLQAAVDGGVTFIDTADVYGDGRSEQIIGSFVKDKPQLTVATKMGRRMAQEVGNYTLDNFRAWTDRSRANLGVETLDLVQLHCPPTPVFSSDAVYDALDTMVQEKRIKAYGVSVEKVDQALSAIARPGVASVQIILNAFRLKPLERVLPAAAEAGVGIIARVPLASGLLSGKYDASTTFAADDHRSYNRDGSAFDVGETFSGVPYDVGLEASAEFGRLVEESAPDALPPAQAAIAWVWQQPGVGTVIPGARSESQARSNAAAGRPPALGEDFLGGVRRIYDGRVRELVHHRW